MKTTKCEKCTKLFRNNVFARHVIKCGSEYTKLKSCPFCNHILQDLARSNVANHVRWCTQNPKQKEYRDQCRTTTQLNTVDAIRKRTQKIKQAHKDGKYDHIDRTNLRPNFKHSDKSKQLMQTKALSSPHRRLVRSIRPYTKKDGTIVMLDSSWEETLAKRLDELMIDWIRPTKPLKWIDSINKTHNYFPDFYLPYYNVYLDPKNPQALKVQKEKVDHISRQYDNILIIESETDCKNFTPG